MTDEMQNKQFAINKAIEINKSNSVTVIIDDAKKIYEYISESETVKKTIDRLKSNGFAVV